MTKPPAGASVSPDPPRLISASDEMAGGLAADASKGAYRAPAVAEAARRQPPVDHVARRRARLIHLLLGKAAVELLFVAALAVNFAYTNFNPHFRGAVDKADAHTVAGWVVNDAAMNPSAPVEVQLYVDTRFAGSQLADCSRPDVLAAGRAPDERHGFSFDVPPQFSTNDEHEARVYAVHADEAGRRRTLQLVGRPLRFHVASSTEK